jgi:hypothetical protein
MKILDFSTGVLLRPYVRHKLKHAELLGCKWKETKGFLKSHFLLKGPDQYVCAFENWLYELKRGLK